MAATVFGRELQKFRKRLKPDQEKSFEGTTVDDLRLTMASIQKQQVSSRTNQNITRLRPFLEAIESYTKVLDTFVNVHELVAFIRGPVRFLLQVAHLYSDAFNTLLETYETIGRQMPLLVQYETLFERNQGMEQALEHMFQSIFDFHLRALQFFQAGKWEKFFKIHVFKDKFKDIIDGLRQHKELVEKQADLAEFQQAKEARLLAASHYQRMVEVENLHRRTVLEGWLDAPNMAGQRYFRANSPYRMITHLSLPRQYTQEPMASMFLYAKLVMDNLLGQTNRHSMEAELDPEVFPLGLNQAYHRIIVRILDDGRLAQKSSAEKLLAWVVCAARPLKWREIQCAATVDADGGTFNPHKRIVLDPKELCGSLVELQTDGTLQLVHTTARYYLIASKVVHEQLEHLKLTQLCLEQFCLPPFYDQVRNDELAAYILAGDFAFFEYSIINWVFHLIACSIAGETQQSSRIIDYDHDDFAQTTRGFLDIHYIRPTRKPKSSKRLISTVDGLHLLEASYKKQLLEVVAAASCLFTTEIRDPCSYEALMLYRILRQIRIVLEQLAADPANQPAITHFYGPTPFKCPRIYCKWFSEGFATRAMREDHVAKHDRAHYCPYFGCAHATLGCTTANELDAHLQACHRPPLTDNDFPPNNTSRGPHTRLLLPAFGQTGTNVLASTTPSTGPQVPSGPAQNGATPSQPRQSGPATCKVCDKVFTRASHLRSHQLVHSRERPYSCSRCQLSFARQPDLTRHEKLHYATKQFVCGGTIGPSGTWGCGKKFMRADHLVRHFKGASGKLCLASLAEEKQKQEQKAQSTGTGTGSGSHTTQPQVQQANSPVKGSHAALAPQVCASTQPPSQAQIPRVDWLPTPYTGDVSGWESLYEPYYSELAQLDWDSVPPD